MLNRLRRLKGLLKRSLISPGNRRSLAQILQHEADSQMPEAVRIARSVPESLVRSYAPKTFGYQFLADGRRDDLDRFVRSGDGETAMAIAGYALSAGERALAQQWFDLVAERGEAPERRVWLSEWLGEQTETEPYASPRIAVFDYRHGDRNLGSINLGDWVQSIAALGMVARFTSVELGGEPGLADFARELQSRVDPAAAVPTRGSLSLVSINRDFSSEERFDEPVWLLSYGWFMWPKFGTDFDFPFPDEVNPIFVSFHCNNPALLTPEALDYLRERGPIGCRDWTTVRLLLSREVPAFFSGCLTTTLGSVIRRDQSAQATDELPQAWVEADPPAGAPQAVAVTQVDSDVLLRTFSENLRVALSMLDRYRDEFSSVVTSRLHCYLPNRAMGTPVDFRPLDPQDVRFDGLAGMDDATFDAMAAGITDKVQQVLGWIVAGDAEADVYAKWRQLVAPDVELAKSRIASEV